MTLDDYLKEVLGDKFVIDETLVVGPYITSDFVSTLSVSGDGKALSPRTELTVLADDGWDASQLDEIRKIYPSSGRGGRVVTIHRVSPSRRSGLVHAKIYFLTLVNKDRTYTKQVLLFGSANASLQGFGSHAETFINLDLLAMDAHDRRALRDYFSYLKSGKSVQELRLSLGKGSWFSLPALNVSRKNVVQDFDAWLRRGRLCHKYLLDSTFGKLFLRLKAPLPVGAIEGALHGSGFGSETESQVFSRKYVSLPVVRDEENDGARWRSQYFVESMYGHWVGAECYSEFRHLFKASKAVEREVIVENIARSTQDIIEERLSLFRESLLSAGERIAPSGSEQRLQVLKKYFHLRGDEINPDSYLEVAKKKLQSDQLLAQDPGFKDRFTSGYRFLKVPQLDDDFEEFARDWATSILNKLCRQRVGNKLVQAIRSELEGVAQRDYPRSPDDLLAWLRREWRNVGSRLQNYHTTENLDAD